MDAGGKAKHGALAERSQRFTEEIINKTL